MADQFGRIIETILRNQNLSINDQEYVELRDGLKWYQRFHQMGKTELIDKSRGVFLDVREISSHLKVHYKWLAKFIKKLLALSRDSGAKLESSDFSEKYLNVAIDADKYRKIRKKIKKLLFVPSPHISESSMIFHERLRSISRKLEIIEEDLIDSLRTKLKVVSVSSPDNLIVRKNLIEICVKSFENVVEDATRIEEMSGDVSKIEEINSKREVETSEDFVEIEIWPIYEFFFFLFAYRFQRRFCDEFSDDFKEEMRRNFEKNFDKGNQTSENLVDCHAETAGESFGRIYKESVFRKFENVPTIPPRLIGLMKALNANEISTRRRITLLPELLFSVEEFAERSFAVKNSNILLHWYDNEEDGTEENFNIFQVIFNHFHCSNSEYSNLIISVTL
ncbi:hypothetical protein K0M31_008513 [Melipona bicolor]|uniref:Uncharacterized protein n=1 Tax=Melipona bicolor TaxID=60889 RepID=A0AA40FRU4_9HYME|nr:hypothetical protein K0M31_008513 [Melipona bicolor]